MPKRTPLRIPTRVTLGQKRYVVKSRSDGKHLGTIYYKDALITLAHECNGRKLAVDEREYAYLHEITHGILEAMEHKLHRSEAFVTDFSLLLHRALTTARY